MATRVEKWRSTDGSEFGSEEEALRHDNLVASVARIMSKLKPVPSDDGCRFANGHGFVQQKMIDCMNVASKLLGLARSYMPDDLLRWFDAAEKEGEFKYRHSMICRFIDDCCPRPINAAWSRIGCIDDKAREWGQQYYAINPTKGDQVEVK